MQIIQKCRPNHSVLSLTVRHEVVDRVDALAMRLGLSRSAFLRRMLRRELEQTGVSCDPMSKDVPAGRDTGVRGR